jgi:hypothetical protein
VSFEEILSFPYLIGFSQQEGVQELDVSLVVCPRRLFFCLLEHGSLYLVLWFIYDLQGFIILMILFALYFLWMGSHPCILKIIYRVFLLYSENKIRR